MFWLIENSLLVARDQIVICAALVVLCCAIASNPSDTMQEETALSLPAVKRTIGKLRSLHTKLGKPQPGEWLATHEERGQSFTNYVRSKPNVLSGQRRKLYVQPIGEFTRTEKDLIQTSAEFLGIYFNCKVVTKASMPESEIPESAQRTHPTWRVHQLLTSHILDEILTPKVPSDAFAVIAFTKSDLWPGDGWNFVFGYASLRNRVGVWSLARFGDPDENEKSRKQCLSRTIKVATHETGHMFSMPHCTTYQCNMQGSNSLAESDQQPLFLCPICHAKLLYATGCDPVERFKKLIEFCEENKLEAEKEYFQRAISKLE